jgi:hypothetical protein
MSSLEKHEYGKTLEWAVAQKLIDLGLDKYARPSKGSGNSTEIADIKTSVLHCECKRRDTKSITIHPEIWKKLLLQKPIDSKKLSCYVLQNALDDKFVVLGFDDFFDLLKKAKENE